MVEVTTAEQIGREVAEEIVYDVGEGYIPYGVVGVVIDCDTILCAGCADDSDLAMADWPSLIKGDSEMDAPMAVCRECEKTLACNLLVYP